MQLHMKFVNAIVLGATFAATAQSAPVTKVKVGFLTSEKQRQLLGV